VCRERELAKIKLKAEDIDLVVNEMDIDKAAAERALRQHGGDVAATLKTLVTSFPQLEVAAGSS
jgi:NACalpha-BTF3-like transcription factor